MNKLKNSQYLGAQQSITSRVSAQGRINNTRVRTSLFLCGTIILMLCGTLTQAQPITGKSYAYHDAPPTNGLSGQTNLTPILPHRSHTIQGAVSPDLCHEPGATDVCSNSAWTGNNVLYSDWPAPVAICICKGAPYTVAELAKRISQVPLYLRRWLKAVGSVQDTYTHAETYFNGYMVVWSKSTNNINTDLFIHETAHAQEQDFTQNTQVFANAINGDRCVPDEYAASNIREDYAQVMVVFLYKLWHKSLPAPGQTCMNGQLSAIGNSKAAGLQQYKRAVQKLPDCSYNCLYTAKSGQSLKDVANLVSCGTKESTFLGEILTLNPLISDPNQKVSGKNVCFPQRCCKK